MTQQLPAQVESYLHLYQALQRDGFPRDPAWVQALREAALDRFSALGFPTSRRGNEEWKYTDVGPIAQVPFEPPSPSPLATSQVVEPLTLEEAQGSRLVFVDGSYAADLSSRTSLPVEVSLSSLAEAMTTGADLVEAHLARYADYATKGFTALNTAFFRDGAFLYVPDGVVVEAPLLVLFLSTAHVPDTVTHPRVLIVTGKDSRLTVIEGYGGPAGQRYFTNAVTEMVLGQGSAVRYHKLQRQGEQAFHITTTEVVLGRGSSLSSVNIDLGGGLVRNNLNVLMGDEEGSCKLLGLYMVTGTQHVDNQVIIDHARPYTASHELYKGILDGRGRSVFHGSILVRQGARKVNAYQVDKNLLLSDRAQAYTKPAFWIYCDDVKCGHGAACGQIDETALFYLRSRGLSEQAARGLLTHAFISEVIAGIEYEPFRTYVDRLAQSTLRSWLGDKETT